MPSTLPTILLLGNDAPLAYLIGRYAERSGLSIQAARTPPPAREICALLPAVVLFSSLENLEASQALIAELENCDIPLLVCSSAADEVRAHEMGADYCLVHPLTYESFLATLTATRISPVTDNIEEKGKREDGQRASDTLSRAR
jgi:DNA-binding response OmpR family regulator